MAALLWLGISLAAHAQTTVEYIHTDALGTPIAVTDANKMVIETTEYEPYGAQVAGPVKDGPGFTGHVQDVATGLTYMQQRYYDPQVGMFLSVDPVTAHDDPFNYFNRYRYAGSNPYRFTDPDGRCWLCDFLPTPRSDRTNPHAPIAGANRGDAKVMMVVATPAIVGAAAAAAPAVAVAVLARPEAIAAAGEVAAGAAGVTGVGGVALTAKQAANLGRFEKNLPKANTGTTVDALGDGVVFTAQVPGNVPGSSAVYQKTVDAAGDTSSFLKTAYDPKGNVMHIKDKIEKDATLPTY